MDCIGQDSGGDSLNILIVEDRPRMQILMKRLMGQWGYCADIVSSGPEAVERTREMRYDLCLMNRQMPAMDGFNAFETIRRGRPHLPVIMYSMEDPLSGFFLFKKRIEEWIDKNTGADYFREKNELWRSARTYSVVKQGDHFVIKKEMPMDAKYAQELKKLAKQDLCKMSLKGSEITVIVHKNVPYKIAHDFIEKELEVSVFLDRNPDNPGEYHLYRSSNLTPVVHYDAELYNEKLMREDEDIQQYTNMIFKKSGTYEK